MTRATLLAVASLFLFSCTRSDDPAPPPGGNPPPAAAKRLAHMYLLDTTAVPVDTLAKGRISYDALGRAQQFSYANFNSNGVLTDSGFVKFEYMGNDSLASKKITYDKIFGATTRFNTDTIYLAYVNGRRNYDSSRYASDNTRGYEVRRRLFEGNIIRESINYSGVSQGTPYSGNYTRVVHATRVNGNLVQQRDTTRTQVAPNNVFTSTFDISLAYTTVLNPFYKVMMPGNDEVVGDDLSNFSLYSVPRYLFSSASGTYSSWNSFQTPPTPGGIGSRQYSYSFGPDGYVTVVKETRNSGSGTETLVTHLVYE